MAIEEKRRAIRHLLDETDPADLTAVYFAFHHTPGKTAIFTHPPDGERAAGYLATSRTGMDLFRPLLTMRLPDDETDSVALIYNALQPGMPAIVNSPARYAPLLKAFFEVQGEERMQVMRLRPNQFEPVINVLVTRDDTPDGRPRFVIRNRQGDNEIVASASTNWQTPQFADIAINTHPQYRREGYGRSVAAAMIGHLLEKGIQPLYFTATNNDASIALARRLGFIDTGAREVMLHATLGPPPR